MSSPLIAIIIFVLIDIIFSQFSKKNKQPIKSPKELSTKNQRKGFLEMLKDLEENISLELKDREPIVESKGQPNNVKPAEIMKAEFLRKQQLKKDKRVALEKRSLAEHKNEMIQNSRLSEQISLNSGNKSLMDDYDLDQRREVSIKASQAINKEKQDYINTDFNIKNDILKAVVYAEILSKPKSLRNK